MPGASDKLGRSASTTGRAALNARQRDAGAKVRAVESDSRVDEEFLAMLAHEFRNPLAPIRSAVEIMRVIGQKDPALEKAREMISRQVDQLSRLVDQLLDVSHLAQGTMALEKTPIDVNAVLWRAVELVQPLIDERGHELRVRPFSQPVNVEGDFDRLTQIFVNLLDNAARYTEAGGEIEIKATKDGDSVTIAVKDDGAGIAPESLPVIFDLFTKAHRSAERPQGGLGIGLSLVRKLVDMHEGSVEVQSTGLKQGSEFVVRLPLLTQSARSGRPLKSQPGRDMPRRIVLIDDNRDAAESLAMLLRLKGHEVHIAYDGPTGVELALKTLPDCVLVDIGLPGIDGHEVAKRLRPQHEDGMLLVALTGYGQSGDRIKSEQAGFDHHLVKPVAQSVLEDLLRER